MITFKQLSTGTPPDIEATTDDSQAELAEWTDMFSELEWHDAVTADNLRDAKLEDGQYTFVISGDEAGELADYNMPLANFLDECNTAVIERAESEMSATEPDTK